MVNKIQNNPLSIGGILQRLKTKKEKIQEKIQDTRDDQIQIKPCANVPMLYL